jgi:hypothetical protein
MNQIIIYYKTISMCDMFWECNKVNASKVDKLNTTLTRVDLVIIIFS